jgi:hypothetical protein
MNNDASAGGFPSNWREALNEMQRDWEREELTLTEEEILAQVGHEKPLRDFLQEMRAQVAGK